MVYLLAAGCAAAPRRPAPSPPVATEPATELDLDQQLRSMGLEQRCALARILVEEAAEMLRRVSITTGSVRVWFASRAGFRLIDADEFCEAETDARGARLFWGGRVPTRYSFGFTVGSANVARWGFYGFVHKTPPECLRDPLCDQPVLLREAAPQSGPLPPRLELEVDVAEGGAWKIRAVRQFLNDGSNY